jgi:hypothetical protein
MNWRAIFSLAITKSNKAINLKDKYLFMCGLKKWFKPWMADKTIFYLANEQDAKLRMSMK